MSTGKHFQHNISIYYLTIYFLLYWAVLLLLIFPLCLNFMLYLSLSQWRVGCIQQEGIWCFLIAAHVAYTIALLKLFFWAEFSFVLQTQFNSADSIFWESITICFVLVAYEHISALFYTSLAMQRACNPDRMCQSDVLSERRGSWSLYMMVVWLLWWRNWVARLLAHKEQRDNGAAQRNGIFFVPSFFFLRKMRNNKKQIRIFSPDISTVVWKTHWAPKYSLWCQATDANASRESNITGSTGIHYVKPNSLLSDQQITNNK